jgi:AcrR family transcriptional regulator
VLTKKRRIGAEGSATRTTLLDVTERLMIEEGYAAVTTRRVAAIADLTPPLVHYYFPTTSDLLLAVYERAALRNRARLAESVQSPQPLRAIWRMSVESMQTTLASEFMALANHRKEIGVEIAKNIARSRNEQAAVFAAALEAEQGSFAGAGAKGLSFILTAISRAVVLERGIGVSAGHRDALAFVEQLLTSLEQARAARE